MKHSALLLAVALAFSGVADAKGGFSGGGRSSGGFSSGGRSMSAAPSRPSAPIVAPAPAPSKGGFNSAQRPAQPVQPSAPVQRTTTTTTSTTSVNRTTSGGYGYRSPYVGGGVMYGGFGMGYGYSNGLLTGMIIGNMMHPHNTVIYSGGGMYNNNALLYPDGRVVNQQGYQVGMYQNGQFTPVNGGMVAQAVPADAGQYQNSTQVAQPVIIQNTGPSTGEIVGSVIVGIFCIILVFVIFL